MAELNLIDLLKVCDQGVLPFEKKRAIRLIRHADPTYNLERLVRLGQIEEYQKRQAQKMLRDAEYLVTFIGEAGTRSRFFGVYKVDGINNELLPWSDEFAYPDMPTGDTYYELSKVPGFEALEDRLVIDWGRSTRSWVQLLRPKSVIELLPKGYVSAFPGYDDVILSFAEMKRVIDNPDANRIWHTMLAGAAGIYLITDTDGGEQYIGSAYGKHGILGRWRSYAETKHGGNTKLKNLLANHPGRHHAFLYSILKTLPKGMTQKEVIAVESVYKRKFGTRAFGLNSN